MIIEKELNFYYNKPTVNGRIYSQEILLRELKKNYRGNDPIFVLNGAKQTSEVSINIQDIIGKVIDFNDDGEKIKFNIKSISNKKEELLLLQSCKYVTIAGFGNINEKCEVEDSYILLYLFPILS